MKHLFTFILVFVFTGSVFSQNWNEEFYKPGNQKSSANFYQLQKEFNNYWAPYDVKAGYYYIDGKKHKASGWKQFKRWEWLWETRINRETGEFPDINIYEIQKNFLKTKNTKSDVANWQSMGPDYSDGGYAGIGRINCITFHPTNNNIFWIGAPSGGLWKTTDGGASWEVLTKDLPVIGVSAIVLANDYETSKTLYIATGDRDAGDNYSIGVLKSTDDGVTWNETGLKFNVSSQYRITRMLMHPNNSNLIYVSTNGGIFRTTNGGTSWNSSITSEMFFDMEFRPEGEDTVLYAASLDYSGSPKVYKTTDAGENWNAMFSFPSNAYRVELDVAESNPGVIYALASTTSGGLEGVYKSTNSALSFTKVYDGTISGNNLLNWYQEDNDPDTDGQGSYDLTLAVNPSDENTLFLGGINTWKSTDGGVSWSLANHWYGGFGGAEVHADKHYMEYQNASTFFEANDGGIYKSTDGGVNWTDLTDGMVISQMYKLGVARTVKDEVITGLQDNGSKLITAGTWYDVKGGDGMECLIDYTDANVQYATYVNGQIDRTTDHWANWMNVVDISANIPDGPNGAWVTPYIIDPVNNQTIYVGYEDVWKTTNRGDTWTKISNLSITSKIRSMAIAPSNNNVMYIADYDYLYKTTDGGTNWTNMSSYLPATFNSINYITIDNDDPSKLWICFGGYDNDKVYESTNGGTSWTNISSGLPSVPANTIVQDIYADVQHLYVGTDLGVYFKEGSGEWQLYSNQLPSVIVTELEIYYDNTTPQNTTLYASTYGRGLWKTGLARLNIQPSVEITSSESGTTNSSPFDITITFNKDVTGFEQADIDVTNGTVSSFSSVSNSVYNAEITPTAAGEVIVSIAANVAQDEYGNYNTSAQWSITYSTTGIENLTDLGVKMYPNPFNGVVVLEFAETFKTLELNVYDIQGKNVYNDVLDYESVKEIDLSQLQNGVYFLKLNMDGQIINTRIVKK